MSAAAAEDFKSPFAAHIQRIINSAIETTINEQEEALQLRMLGLDPKTLGPQREERCRIFNARTRSGSVCNFKPLKGNPSICVLYEEKNDDDGKLTEVGRGTCFSIARINHTTLHQGTVQRTRSAAHAEPRTRPHAPSVFIF